MRGRQVRFISTVLAITFAGLVAAQTQPLQLPVSTPGPFVEYVRTGNDLQDSLNVRSAFLAKLSPEAYECFHAAPELGQKGLIFLRVYAQTLAVAGGFELPPETVNVCTGDSPNRPRSVPQQSFLAGLRLVLRSALRSPLAADAVTHFLPESPSEPIAHVGDDAKARERLKGAQGLVTAFVGEPEGAAFLDDVPLVQARKAALAGLAIARIRKWPNAWMIGMADTGSFSDLSQFWGTQDHPDVRDYPRGTEEQRALIYQRKEVEFLNRMVRATTGPADPPVAGPPMPFQEFSDWISRGRGLPDPRGLIQEVFGSAMVARYEQALKESSPEPGYAPTDIANAALVLKLVLPKLTMSVL